MFGASKPKPDPPENDDDDDESTDVAGFLSQELLKLSLVDRTAIQEEIHGVRCLAVPETPELLQTSLHEFSKEVDRHVRNATSNGNGNGQSGSLLPASKTWAYRQLLEQYNKKNSRSGSSNMNFNSHSNFALDDAFRLRFLRCELFDVARAVVRFFHYLDYTYEYWGEVALQRPIMFQDFTKAELKVLKKGYFQLLPFRDSSGRRIMVVLGGMDPHQDIRARNKIYFYLWDVVTRDSVESQQKGFVMIRLHGNISNEDATSSESSSSESTTSANPSFRSVIDNLNRSLSSIPSRLIANHNRIPNHPGHRLVWKLFVTKVLSGENAGLRPRFIACPSGSDMETKYSLKSYGIPTQLLPLTDTDSIKCTYHTQWMKTRKLLEEQEFGVWNPPRKGASASATTATRKAAINSKYTVVECPGLNDVIFRKGSRVTSIENPGNRFFRDLLRTFLEEKERVSEQLKQEEEGFITPDEESSFLTSTSPISRASSPPLPISATTASKATPLPSAGGKKNTGKAFCDWLVEHIEEERNGRFLEWNNDIHCWVVMEDRNQTSRKVSITLYNWGKRFHTETAASKRLKQQQQQQRSNPILPMRHGSQSTSDEDDNLVGVENNPFQFIDGGRHPYEPRGHCCDSFTGAYGNPTSSIGRKRPRIETTPSIKPAIFQWGSIPN